LMMTNPGDFLEAFRKAGADGCTVHVEVGDTSELLAEARKLGLHAGLAINPETPFEAIEPFLDQADLILVMTVHPGFGGQSFMEDVVPKIARVRQELDRRGLKADLEVDGGIDDVTTPVVVRAGARVLVAGTAIFGMPRPAEAARKIREIGLAALSDRSCHAASSVLPPVYQVPFGALPGFRRDFRSFSTKITPRVN
jgi:ribulose-phosphate 3-epimerase